MSLLRVETGRRNDVLRQKSQVVEKFDKKLRKLIRDMEMTMLEQNGVGLAAPQVGVNLRMILVTMNYDTERERVMAMVNPEILFFSEEKVWGEEGCLSLPGEFEEVLRPAKITVRFLDEKGREQILNLEGSDARIVQHEVDHLDGVLFVDRLERNVVMGSRQANQV